jgi:AcrR family transcriptional regulator
MTASDLAEAGLSRTAGIRPRLPEAERRQALIRVAEDVFLAQGYAAANMDDVARGARMSKKTLYQLFSSKEALFEAVMTDHLAPLLESTPEEAEGDLREGLIALMERAAVHASVARYGQPREKRSVCGEPAGYELGEEPHALRLACLPLREKPERSVHVQVGARHPRQQGVGISDEARQRRDPEPLPYRNDLRRGVRGPERNPRGANLTLAGPIRNSMTLMTIHRMGSGAPARHAASRSRDM